MNKDAAKEAKENYSRSDVGLEVGKYLGKAYYTNSEEGNVVTTRVRQVVDYVDNDLLDEFIINSTSLYLVLKVISSANGQ